MAVFRIEKTRDYTVMSNHHLKDRTLTLKSKGLLSMMLSLPDEWNYTTRGLAAICREGVDSIGAALKELETHGYIRRTQLRDEKGKITDTEYVIYEMPQCEPPSSPGTPLPGTAKPYTENPDMGIPDTAEPCTENPAQLNTNQTKTDLSSTELSNPIQSNPPTPTGARMGTDRMGARECYREVILDNIEYSYLVQDSHIDREQLDLCLRRALRNPLPHPRALLRFLPPRTQSRNRPHPPDPRPHGLHRPSAARRYPLQQNSRHFPPPGTSLCIALLRPSDHRRTLKLPRTTAGRYAKPADINQPP